MKPRSYLRGFSYGCAPKEITIATIGWGSNNFQQKPADHYRLRALIMSAIAKFLLDQGVALA
jgi:hypothetical protein